MPTVYPIARAALFKLPPETAHDVVLQGLAVLPAAIRRTMRSRNQITDPRLHATIFGVDFPNPVGLAAGFDKSGAAFNSLGALGFGFVEIGTITALAQPGNPRPRVFRLPTDQALLNRMGFNNPGAEAVADRLSRASVETVLGINIGKSKITPNARAVDDYLWSVELLERFAHYLVVNVSSPNTPGLRELQDAAPLRELLSAVVDRAGASVATTPVPVLVKIAPDLTDHQVDQAVGIAMEVGAAGIIVANTTISREGLSASKEAIAKLGAGGISGTPIRARALALVSRIYTETGGAIPIVGVGGVFTADDAWDRIRAGASLVQLYTGLIYQGPEIVKQINLGLLERLDAHGFGSIAEAVGTGAV